MHKASGEWDMVYSTVYVLYRLFREWISLRVEKESVHLRG